MYAERRIIMTDEEQKYIESDIKAVKEIYENMIDKRWLYFDTDSLKLDKEKVYVGDFIYHRFMDVN